MLSMLRAGCHIQVMGQPGALLACRSGLQQQNGLAGRAGGVKGSGYVTGWPGGELIYHLYLRHAEAGGVFTSTGICGLTPATPAASCWASGETVRPVSYSPAVSQRMACFRHSPAGLQAGCLGGLAGREGAGAFLRSKSTPEPQSSGHSMSGSFPCVGSVYPRGVTPSGA